MAPLLCRGSGSGNGPLVAAMREGSRLPQKRERLWGIPVRLITDSSKVFAIDNYEKYQISVLEGEGGICRKPVGREAQHAT